MNFLLKDPSSSLDYEMDWGEDYLAQGDLIAQSDWTVSPVHDGGLAVVASTHDGASAQVTVTGGAAGTVYRLANNVVTASGRLDTRSLTLRVEAR